MTYLLTILIKIYKTSNKFIPNTRAPDNFQVQRVITVDEPEYTNYYQLSFKVKNKNVMMLHNSK
jgi:hypothetical protein